MVRNKDDSPEFWFSDGLGKPHFPTDRCNVWCHERCLPDENRITQKGWYNLGSWPYEELDYAALKRTKFLASGPGILETIEQGDEDNE